MVQIINMFTRRPAEGIGEVPNTSSPRIGGQISLVKSHVEQRIGGDLFARDGNGIFISPELNGAMIIASEYIERYKARLFGEILRGKGAHETSVDLKSFHQENRDKVAGMSDEKVYSEIINRTKELQNIQRTQGNRGVEFKVLENGLFILKRLALLEMEILARSRGE